MYPAEFLGYSSAVPFQEPLFIAFFRTNMGYARGFWNIGEPPVCRLGSVPCIDAWYPAGT